LRPGTDPLVVDGADTVQVWVDPAGGALPRDLELELSAQVPAIIRGAYAHHVNGRGSRDIGYNFLVDRFGRIWEGPYGGIDGAVIGAHTAGYNATRARCPSWAPTPRRSPKRRSSPYKRQFAWRFVQHGVNPSAAVARPGGETLSPVAGHRDTTVTNCPGGR
jgi:hypothetical protein